MTRKKAQDMGPSTFFEWVIGTTVENATRYHNKPKKKFRRERVRIELSTDDESETDSLKVTYPRSGSRGDPAVALVKPKVQSQAQSREADGVKKVRFEEDGKPLKSALKKITTTTVEEIQTDEETDDESDGEKPTKKCKTKKKDDSTSEEESAASDNESTCDCSDCVRARQKAKKKQPKGQQQQCLKKQKGQKKKAAAEESEDSESDTPAKKNKEGKKKGKKAEFESEGESSAEDTDSESEKNNVSKKQKQKGGKKGKNQTPDESSAGEEEKPTKKNKNQQQKKNNADPNTSKKRDQEENANKKGNYPEGLPGPHPRRPNYIEPVRAEVVQTERVMEGPEDPRPNAYYDSEHNIVRVYYGPVYGGNHGQGLYPKRDPSGRPLPMGTPHPTQNPYFNSFKDGNAEGHGATSVPVSQGMPMNSMYAPGPWGYPPPHMMYPSGPPPPVPEGGWNKGAFAQVNAAGGPGENNSATNNAGPGSVKAPSLEGKNNPYYQRATANLPRSKFSGWGSHGSRKASERSEAAPWGPTGSNNGGNNSWGHNSNRGSWGGGNINASNGNWNGEPAQLSGQQDSFPKDTSWETPNNGKQTDGANDWGTTNNNNNNNAADSWGNVNQTSNTDSWGANAGPNDWNAPRPSPPKTAEAPEVDNVGPMPKMPGSWDSTPAWGDPTAAAATGGAVDNEVDDGMPYGGW